MKDLPCIFSTPMVRQLLAGRKTQTRRLVTTQWANLKKHFDSGETCRIYVREAFAQTIEGGRFNCAGKYVLNDIYKADYQEEPKTRFSPPRQTWKPSIHMPRKLSRITLNITDVRLQRLRDITDQDAIAEGFSSADDFLDYFFELHPIPDQLNFMDSLADNPDVYAISFNPEFNNIDRIEI